jgi:hypothetical protein
MTDFRVTLPPVRLDWHGWIGNRFRAMNPLRPFACATGALAAFSIAHSSPAADPASPRPPTVITAPTGHRTNYDEAKVGTYTLPDPLVLNDGEPVRDAATWYQRRKPEILELYRRTIFGRVPQNLPKAIAQVVSVDSNAVDGTAVRKLVLIRFGEGPGAPFIRAVIYLPLHRTAPVPVFLQMAFNAELPFLSDPTLVSKKVPPAKELGQVADILARGYAYAIYLYSDLQIDQANTRSSGLEALVAGPGASPPPDAWGAIGVWAWGASRVLDYLETDPDVNARKVALVGHSRLGKTALWAGAEDPRFAMVLASCPGELGASISRRDYGETVDDLVSRYPWWFAPGFGRYAGHWDQLPVDAHMLIALNAPRPVFVTAGSGDLWADPKGEFLGEMAAGPVYRLVGAKELGATEMPSQEVDVTSGDLAFRFHTGPHAIVPSDWAAFLTFADRYLR